MVALRISMLLGVALMLMIQSSVARPQTAKWKRPSPPVSHDFEDPSLDHTGMAMKWDAEGKKDLSLKAFESAAR